MSLASQAFIITKDDYDVDKAGGICLSVWPPPTGTYGALQQCTVQQLILWRNPYHRPLT